MSIPRATRLNVLADLTDPRHGTVSCYRNYGCRCAPCTEAQRLGFHALVRRASAEAWDQGYTAGRYDGIDHAGGIAPTRMHENPYGEAGVVA